MFLNYCNFFGGVWGRGGIYTIRGINFFIGNFEILRQNGLPFIYPYKSSKFNTRNVPLIDLSNQTSNSAIMKQRNRVTKKLNTS